MMMTARAILFLTTTLALAPGLVTNIILKDNWSRPRPIDVIQFGGEELALILGLGQGGVEPRLNGVPRIAQPY